jgi:uncharacterized protein
MGRFLILILLVVAVMWLVKRAVRRTESPDVAQKPPVQGELVPCARCGVNLPRAEAREAAGSLFCSDEHARLGRA